MKKHKLHFDPLWLIPFFVLIILAVMTALIVMLINNGNISSAPNTVVVTQQTVSVQGLEGQALSGSYTVCLDAGHGGRDPGTQDKNSHYEKTDNLEFTLLVKEALLNRGISVLLTRNSDTYMALERRAAVANNKKVDLFISFHRNYSDNPKAYGIEGWINKKSKNEDYNLAYHILKRLNAVGDTSRTVIGVGTANSSKNNYLLNSATNMPSVLFEMGYMSNDEDNLRFAQYKTKYAEAIADGVVDWLLIFKEN